MKPSSVRPTLLVFSAACLIAFAGVGCAPQSDVDAPAGSTESELYATNGMSFNGMSFNGMSFNGMSFNGMSFNGMSFNGLLTDSNFASWFNGATQADATNHANFMKYFVGCALNATQSVSYKDLYGRSWTWQGSMGLAPLWSGDSRLLSEADNQLMTACLAAHINTAAPDPKHIQISLAGEHPNLAVTQQERSALATFDGVFFGNVFKGAQSDQRLYLCSPKDAPPANYIQTLLNDWGRQCYFSTDGCHGLFTMVDCSTACGPGTDGAPFGTKCTVDGKTYKAIAVRVPKIKKATDFSVAGGAAVRDCASCLGGKALNGLGTTATYATAAAMTTSAGAGSYLLDLRYVNTASTAGYLTVQVVDPATNAATTVMNGTSTKFTFPVTSAVQQLTIPVKLPNNATLKLVGAGSPLLSIESAVLRMP